MSYIGNEPIVSATRTITEVTATAGQTVFNANGGYTVGYIDVFLNGAQLQTVDFTATDGSSITLTEAAQVGDVIRLVAWGTFSTSNLVSPSYTGTLTGGTDVVNIGSGQVYKDASGNVGIGTSSPASKLQVIDSGAVANTVLFQSGQTGTTPRANTVLRLQTTATGRDVNIQFSDNVTNAAEIGMVGGAQYFATAGTERMRIDSSGNLLVGTTGLPQLNATTGTGFGVVNNSSLRLNLTPGVEGCAYNYTNYTNGTTVYPVVFRTNGNTVGYISMTNTAVAYVTSSDYRLKENIAPMTGALAKVAKLKPVTYQWKTDGSSGQGFIAHELQEVVPDCVTGEKDAVETYTDEDGTEQVRPRYQGIDTSFLVATLTAAIQEQQAIITELKSRVEALENK